jgi:hemerythrin-like domain-containing protein
MRRIDTPAVQNALATLDTLEKEHEKANVLHQDIHALGMQCLELGPLSAADTLRFRQALRELAAIYGEHIRVEDNEIFPTAQRALSDVDKAAIAAEMASRRNNRG